MVAQPVEIYSEFSHWSALVPLVATVVVWWKGRKIAPAAWLLAFAFFVSWASDVAVDLVAPTSNNWWISWAFAPFELVLLAFAVNRTPMVIVLFIVALTIADGALLQVGAASIATTSPLTSVFGWISVAIYSERRGNRGMLVRKAVSVYSCGAALMWVLSQGAFPDRPYQFWIGYTLFQIAKVVSIAIFLMAIGLWRIPLRGLSLLSLPQRFRLDHGVRGLNHVESLTRELEAALAPYLALCPERIREQLARFVRHPETIISVGEMSGELESDRRSIQRAYERAGLPPPFYMQKLLRLAHAHARLKDDPTASLTSVAKDLRTDVRTLRRYAKSVLGIPLTNLATEVRTSQIFAALMYPSRTEGKDATAPSQRGENSPLRS